MRERILLVDDEEFYIQALGQRLEMKGYQVQIALTGAAAIETFQTFEPTMVILDCLLPDIHGLELYQKLNAADPDILIIIVSAHADMEMAISGLKKGVFDYLVKPVRFDDLLQKMEMAFARKRLQVH